MAGPFINWVLLRWIETAVTSSRLAHLQNINKALMPSTSKNPKGISKHVITVMLSCKMFKSTELFRKCRLWQHRSISCHKFRQLLQLKRSSWCRQKENTAYEGLSVASTKKYKHGSLSRGLLISDITYINIKHLQEYFIELFLLFINFLPSMLWF